MLNRVTVSLSLVLLGLIASTGAASAATDQDKVIVGTALLALGLMVLLSIIYFLKRALGLEKQGVGEITVSGHGAAHH